MGQKDAENLDTKTDELETDIATEELEDGSEEGEKQEEAQGLDLSLDEDTQPQTDENAWVRNRVNRANKKTDMALEGKTVAEQELANSKERERLKDLQIEHLKGQAPVATKPDAEKFDGGIHDPDFIKQQDAYIEAKIEKVAAEKVAATSQKFVETGNQGQQAKQMERDQTKHYERAFKLGAKDYTETEEKAREYLGESDAKAIMSLSNASELVLYYFGKNEDKARDFANLINSNQNKALLELGRLEEKLKKKVGSKSTITPDPDEPMEGSITPKISATERKLDKLRDEAAKTGKMEKLMAFKKSLKEKV